MIGVEFDFENQTSGPENDGARRAKLRATASNVPSPGAAPGDHLPEAGTRSGCDRQSLKRKFE